MGEEQEAKQAPPAETSGDVGSQRIGFGPRLGALIIDLVLVVVGGGILGTLFGGALGGAIGAGAAEAAAAAEGVDPEAAAALGGVLGAVAGAAVGIAIFTSLYGLIEAFTGASPGKMLIKIKIGNADGTQAPVGKLLLRYALKNSGTLINTLAALIGVTALGRLGGLCGLAVVIGCFFALGEAKQALHDMIAGTAVYPKNALS